MMSENSEKPPARYSANEGGKMKKITIEIDINTKGMEWCSEYNEPLYGDVERYIRKQIGTGDFCYSVKEE